MESNELRIGNYIYGMSGRIEFIRALGVNFCTTGLGPLPNQSCPMYRSIDPIPLTPEILIKMGWSDWSGDQIYAKMGLRINGDCNTIFAYHIKKSMFEYVDLNGYSLPNMKYVHQLQNLYFALTGKELEFEL